MANCFVYIYTLNSYPGIKIVGLTSAKPFSEFLFDFRPKGKMVLLEYGYCEPSLRQILEEKTLSAPKPHYAKIDHSYNREYHFDESDEFIKKMITRIKTL